MANHIAQLKNMFPDMDEESIRSVLMHCRNDVNAAIEKLLTFCEDTKKELSPPLPQGMTLQAAMQEDSTVGAITNPVEKRSHTTHQYHWMSLPPLSPAKQDSLNETPYISPSPQWVYPYPYSLCGPAQSVATDNGSHSSSSVRGSHGNVTTPVSAQPIVKQSPRQQQTSAHHNHQYAQSVKKQLIMMRGLPGSGKSTLARKLKGQTGVIFSTDDYYMVDGVYRFDPSKLGEYHELNQRRAKDALRRGVSPVIIDNTNTTCHEMKSYVSAALQFNYVVEFREPDTPWKFNISTLLRKNTHGVNKVVLERMLDRYERHVTVEMVMGTNKSTSKPTLPSSRDVRSGPVNNSKVGGLITRGLPVTMPTAQHTSPNCKMKRYGNQGNSWHDNQSMPPASSRSDKNNWWRRDDNSSHGHTYQSTKTANTDSNNSTPLFTDSNHCNGRLSIDTKQYTNNVPMQTLSSPHSAEVVRQPEDIVESHSYTVSDLVHPRTGQNSGHNLHHSVSDSVITSMNAHQYSCEPLFIVSQDDTMESLAMPMVEQTAEKQSIANNGINNNIGKKWPSTELYHDSDDTLGNYTINNQAAEDCSTVEHSSIVTEKNDEQVVDDNNSNNSSSSVTELTGIDTDIDFLKSCFPNISAAKVLTVYNGCEHDIQMAVGKLLQLPITSSTTAELIDFNEVRQESEASVRRQLFQEDSSSQTVDDDMEMIMTIEDVPAKFIEEDEKMARALQDELDKEVTEEESNCLTATKSSQNQNEPHPISDCSVVQQGQDDDDGLILRLSPSLASKLQDMFGSVKEHLITDGEPNSDDLVVLLSERAAKEIYKKWLDTLKAKQIETRFNTSVQLRKDVELARQLQREEGGTILIREDEQNISYRGKGQWKKQHRNRQRKQNLQTKNLGVSTKPSLSPSLKGVIQQQGLVEQESQQVSEIVMDACKNSAATHIKVQGLYHDFPSLNQHYIDQLILEHQFNFEQVTSELQRRQAHKPISVVANPSIVGRTVKMSPRKHEITNATNDGAASSHYDTPRQQQQQQSEGRPWINPSHEDIRAEAAIHAQLRAESFQKAAEARSKKQGELAVFYAQQGHLHTSKMNDANERAAEMILSKSNASNGDVIDFHGLFVKEALEALEEKLSTTSKKIIYVVTGKGSHSSGGVARIKPAVIEYLEKKRYCYETVNEGQIKIFVNN